MKEKVIILNNMNKKAKKCFVIKRDKNEKI